MPSDPLHILFEAEAPSAQHGSPAAAPALTFDTERDDLLPLLRALSTALARYPIAVQAAFRVLASEGRAFAETEEGAALRDSLASSPLFQRARLTWETLSLSAFSEQSTDIVPSVYLDAVLRTITSKAMEPLLSRVFDQED